MPRLPSQASALQPALAAASALPAHDQLVDLRWRLLTIQAPALGLGHPLRTRPRRQAARRAAHGAPTVGPRTRLPAGRRTARRLFRAGAEPAHSRRRGHLRAPFFTGFGFAAAFFAGAFFAAGRGWLAAPLRPLWLFFSATSFAGLGLGEGLSQAREAS